MVKVFEEEFLKFKQTLEQNFNLKEFKQLENMLAENKRIEELITRIKFLQKKIIFLETIKKTSSISKWEKEIEEIEKELLAIPIYNQYKDRKYFLDKELQNINEYINEQLNNQIILDKEEE